MVVFPMQQNPILPKTKPGFKDYVPLLLVIGIVILGTVAVCTKIGFSPAHLLGYSMGFFFLIFGMFKVLDLGMFAMGYREYDLLAKNVPVWGYIYPFIELALGAAYLTSLNEPWLNMLTLTLSVLTVISVSIKLAKHETIHCVCLGNILKVPLTYVSLIEYAVMGLMAIVMLFV